MEGVATTPPRKVIQEGIQAVEGNMMQLLFSLLARMEASIQKVEEDRGKRGGRRWG